MAQQQQQTGRGGGGGLGGAGGGPGILAGGGGGAGGGLDADALRNNPAMAQMRQQVMENPALLQNAIQGLVQQNPALAQYLNSNPELLFQILAGGNGGGEGDDDDPFPQTQTITLTEAEAEAIARVSFITIWSLYTDWLHFFAGIVTSAWVYTRTGCRSLLCLREE